MKPFVCTAIIILLLPTTCRAQSDLEKVLRGLRQVQELQRQIEGRQNQRPGQPGNRPPQVPAQGDPNQSGNQNGGGFRDPSRMFPGQPGRRDPRIIQPSPQQVLPQRVQPRTYSNQPIVIHCDPAAPGACRYSLVTLSNRSFPYEIKPGQLQTFPENTEWNFSYQPTGSGPWRTYRLRGGRQYEIRKGGDGRWQLYMLQ